MRKYFPELYTERYRHKRYNSLKLKPSNMQICSNIEIDSMITQIDAILPQTQCEKCGFPGCKPYATAITKGEADINQCPPGGDAGIRALSQLTQIAYKPLNPENGIEKPKSLAFIDEASCIGCTLCIKACPVDAILGASKQMHTVIASECTGCELCVAPCPVDCITMQPIKDLCSDTKFADTITINQMAANLARKRYYFRLNRIEREKVELAQKHEHRRLKAKTGILKENNMKKSALASAIERVRILKSGY